MGKVVFWLVVVFVALFALRIANAAKNRQRGSGAPPARLCGGTVEAGRAAIQCRVAGRSCTICMTKE